MIKKELLLEGKTGTATGTGASVLRFKNKTFVFYGTAVTGTAVVEGSYDDNNYVTLGTLRANEKLAVNDIWTFVRVRLTSISAGTAYVALMATDGN